MTTEQERKIREEVDSIDFDKISDENRLRAIGIEFYEMASTFDTHPEFEGVNVVGIVAGLMNNLDCSVPNRMDTEDAHLIAEGFGYAMVVASANSATSDYDEGETE